MKIRTGFVSNSSSSSFTCEVCGLTESGMDACPRDFEMVECEHGHVLCKDHIKERDDSKLEEEVQERLKEWMKKYPDSDPQDIEDDIRRELEDEYPESVCPICTLEVIRDKDLLRYIVTKEERKEIERTMSNKFGSLKEFNLYMKERIGE